jgi:hypothetical protein
MSNEFKWDEKDEKKNEKDEKDVSKHEEKTVEEKWRRDPLGTIAWAVVLIWAGVVLLLYYNTNIFQSLSFVRIEEWGWGSPIWSLIFVGAGVIFIVEALIRLVVPAYRRPIWGSLFFAIILIGIGLGNVFDWRLVFALVLIFLGLSMFFRRR